MKTHETESQHRQRGRAALQRQISIAQKGLAECLNIEIEKGTDMTDTKRWQEHLDRLQKSLVDFEGKVKSI